MSLGVKLVQAVQKETAMQRPLPLQTSACETLPRHGGVTAAVTLTDNDRFSHLAEEVRVNVRTVAPEGVARDGAVPEAGPVTPVDRTPAGRIAIRKAGVERKAASFAARATYLTESLQLVETELTGTVVLRSSPQTMRAPRTPYFEARVDEDTLSLKRYQPNPDKPGRSVIPFCLTDEVLARLVDDAAEVLAHPLLK